MKIPCYAQISRDETFFYPHPQPFSQHQEKGAYLSCSLGKIEFMGRAILTQVARMNRKKSTPSEECLWVALRDKKLNGWKFRRQNVIGKFITDFCCTKAKLIVELDGAIHDSRDAQIADALRTEFLNTKGYKVIRFRNEEVLHDLSSVLNAIRKVLEETQIRSS